MVVLTPAEELGLSGLHLDARLRQAFQAIPHEQVLAIARQMHDEAARQHLLYLRDGQAEVVHIMLRPIGVMPDQLSYLNFVSLTILNALKRLPDLYLHDFAIRKIAPLSPAEEKWMWDSWGPSHRENNPVLGRLDAVADLTSPMWKDSLRFLEPNLCGVGGLHMGPVAEQLLAELVVPALQQSDPGLRLEVGQDVREIFIQEVFDHLQAIGRQGQNVCFIEPKYAGQGPDEQEMLAQYYHDRHGLRVMHADPRELSLVNGEVMYEGTVVDIAYRDYEVRDLLALERDEQVDVEPVRTLFRENRIVSSMAGEFDHKSCWELLTDPDLLNRYFTAEERQIFRRHILWTRLLEDRRTSLPDGETGELLPYIRQQHEWMVLKPNRSYGGDRVVLGHLIDRAEWDREVDRALADDEDWVVQRLAALPVHEFPVVDESGAVHVEPFYTVLGFAPSKYGLAVIGRASQKQVVNVAQRGGMCGVLTGRSAARLLGPARAKV